MRKFFTFLIFFILIGGGILFWWRFYFVFGEGVKAGELNYVVKKGYFFKTWEGRLIQTGYRSNVPGSVQSNEFEFSVTNPQIAEKLSLSGGSLVELRYKEYLSALPWRGMSKYVVDSIIMIKAERPGMLPAPY